jgi:hypothetical protein
MRDIEIRTSLHNDHLSYFWDDGISRVVDELPICAGVTVADLAVVNGSLHAYEIKGTFDTLARLPKQIISYDKVFDYVTVVTADNHLKAVLELVPEQWGIWVMKSTMGAIQKEIIRVPEKNENKEALAISQLLWKEEAFMLLKKYEMHKGFASKRKWLLWEALAQNIEIDALSSEIRSIVKNRTDWKISRFRHQLNSEANLVM